MKNQAEIRKQRCSFNKNMHNMMSRYLQISSGPRMSYSQLNPQYSYQICGELSMELQLAAIFEFQTVG